MTTTFTIRMPEEKAERVKALAAQKNISVNKLFEEWAATAITAFDTQSHFLARAARGSAEHGLSMLAELDGRNRDNVPPASSYGLHDNTEQEGYESGPSEKDE